MLKESDSVGVEINFRFIILKPFFLGCHYVNSKLNPLADTMNIVVLQTRKKIESDLKLGLKNALKIINSNKVGYY